MKQSFSSFFHVKSYLLLAGIQAEHQHILKISDANNKRFDQLQLYQTLLENHMKDIHAALKGVMGKTKVIAERVSRLQGDFSDQRQDFNDTLKHVSSFTFSRVGSHSLWSASQINNRLSVI